MAHQMQEAKPLNLVRPEVPEELAAVVRKMMAKSPAKRYQTPLEVVQALAPFVKQGATPKPSPELSSGPVEAKPAVKKAARVDPPPVPAAPEAKKQPEPANVWGSLTEDSVASVTPRKSAVVRKSRAATVRESKARNKWLFGGGIGVGVLLLALLGMWARGVFTTKVKTADGILIIEVNEPNAEVFVDGERVTVTWQSGGKKAEVRVNPGTHKVEVKKDGFSVDGKELTFKDGDREIFKAHLLPQKKPEQVSSTSHNGKRPDPPFNSKDLPKALTVDLGSGVKMEFVLIDPKSNADGGIFTMGSVFGLDRNKPPHRVTITKPFYLGKHSVTQEQYVVITGKKNPSYFSEQGGGKDKVAGMDTKQFPVEQVSWDEAKACCAQMKKNDNHRRDFRLPTEAEWEYACRAGTSTTFYFGDDANKLGDYAWYFENSENRPHPVGEKQPNEWGLYDMHGNVFQWCEDYFGPYEELDVKDPLRSFKHSDDRRVVRGGSWGNRWPGNRAAYRDGVGSDARIWHLGFRVAFRPETEESRSESQAPAPLARTAADGFVPLFNGKDLTGWKTEPGQESDWHVTNGVLSRGERATMLWTERDDYRDFHLSVETRLGKECSAWLIVRDTLKRSGGFVYGYVAFLNCANPSPQKTGALAKGGGRGAAVRVEKSPVLPDEWFTLEVIARGNRIIVKVNGQTTADYTDPERLFAFGRISLFSPIDQLEFRKIEIKELK